MTDLEERIRASLRDPRRALDSWPDPMARIRSRAKGRQVLRGAAVAVVVVAVVAAVAVPSLTLQSGRRHPFSSAAPRQRPSGRQHRHPPAFLLPSLGAPGFPVNVYPAPTRTVVNLIGRCPAGRGLLPANRISRRAAVAIATGALTPTFDQALRHSDRAIWAQVAREWRQGDEVRPSDKRVGVLYAAPLTAQYPTNRLGAPDPVSFVKKCGSKVLASSYIVVQGQLDLRALQGESLLLDRSGHVLLWSNQ
jgi:hypothetical protein